MRYRRYYLKKKEDDSVSVVSHGPIIAFGRSSFATWLLSFGLFCWLTPFGSIGWATMIWAFVWATGLAVTSYIVKRKKS